MRSNKKKLILKGIHLQIILYAILTILIIVLLIEYRIIENPKELFNKEKLEIVSDDLCSIIGGKIIHTIKDEESCQNKCIVECESSRLKLMEYTFKSEINNCNKCNCYCTE